MLTNSRLVKALLLATVFGSAGTINAVVIPTSLGATITQQKNKVTGFVEDEMGPVAGASISIKGTSYGTITDMDGNFVLDGIQKGNVLVVSFVGLQTQEVVWNGQSSIKVKLTSDTQDLDEVVVVAYGTAKKSSFTGSASVVKSDQLEKISATSFTEALQGMSAGVNVSNNEGNPGGETRIQIRGISSMSGKTTPLYVVDGMPYDGSINSISPSDIESMTVLKDAAASSLYGSRAANGVVVITTKKVKSVSRL